MVFPVLLGRGKRLFAETPGPKALKLKSSMTVGDGLEVQTYEPAA